MSIFQQSDTPFGARHFSHIVCNGLHANTLPDERQSEAGEQSQCWIGLNFGALGLEVPKCCDTAFIQPSDEYTFGFPAFCGCSPDATMHQTNISQTELDRENNLSFDTYKPLLDKSGVPQPITSTQASYIATTPEAQTPGQPSSSHSPSPEIVQQTTALTPLCVDPSEIWGTTSRGCMYTPLKVEPETPARLHDMTPEILPATIDASFMPLSPPSPSKQDQPRGMGPAMAQKTSTHIQSPNGTSRTCPYADCKKTFNDLCSRNRHILFVHMELGPHCPGCRKQFSRDDSLKRHLDWKPVGSRCRIAAERRGWAGNEHGSTNKLAGRPRRKWSEVIADAVNES